MFAFWNCKIILSILQFEIMHFHLWIIFGTQNVEASRNSHIPARRTSIAVTVDLLNFINVQSILSQRCLLFSHAAERHFCFWVCVYRLYNSRRRWWFQTICCHTFVVLIPSHNGKRLVSCLEPFDWYDVAFLGSILPILHMSQRTTL